MRQPFTSGRLHFLFRRAPFRLKLSKLGPPRDCCRGEAIDFARVRRRDCELGCDDRRGEVVADENSQAISSRAFRCDRLFGFVTSSRRLKTGAPQIDLRNFASIEQQLSDLFELLGCREAQRCRTATGGGERQSVVGLVNCLYECAAGHFRSRASSLQQRHVSAERCAESAPNIEFTGDPRKRFVFCDSVRTDEAHLTGSAGGMRPARRRVVEMRKRTGCVRQKGCSGLSHIFSRDEFGKLRLLKTGGLRDGQSNGFIQSESTGGLTRGSSNRWQERHRRRGYHGLRRLILLDGLRSLSRWFLFRRLLNWTLGSRGSRRILPGRLNRFDWL